jgi:hypothetical protein
MRRWLWIKNWKRWGMNRPWPILRCYLIIYTRRRENLKYHTVSLVMVCNGYIQIFNTILTFIICLFLFPVALQSLKDLGRLTYRRFLELFKTYGRTPWTSDQPVARPLPTQDNKRRGQTSMPWAGFVPTIPATNRPRPTPQTARPLWQATCLLAILNIA